MLIPQLFLKGTLLFVRQRLLSFRILFSKEFEPKKSQDRQFYLALDSLQSID